jgi:hypothetical protein
MVGVVEEPDVVIDQPPGRHPRARALKRPVCAGFQQKG